MWKRMILANSMLMFLLAGNVRAEFTLSFASSDFGVSSTFNDVSFFNFEIVVDDTLAAGKSYSNPTLTRVDYRVDGVLASATPSGFPAFQLVRSIGGGDFYGLSPEATLAFAVSASADLSDGLQMNELVGGENVFTFNAREFNQQPGRYHPPILTLDSDGTGRLVNANNQSTFPNPDPPMGSGELVNVNVGDEYDVALSFSPGLTIGVTAIPEPGVFAMMAFSSSLLWLRRRRRAV